MSQEMVEHQDSQSNLILTSQAEACEESPLMQSILMGSGAGRVDACPHDVQKQHTRGFGPPDLFFLNDGTVLANNGAYTVLQDVDNSKVLIFNENADKLRRVSRHEMNKDREIWYQQDGIAAPTSKGTIVVDARKCDDEGLDGRWILDAINTHESFRANTKALHGTLKQLSKNVFASESMSYRIRPSIMNKDKDVLYIGFSVGILAAKVEEHEWLQRRLRDMYKGLTRISIEVPKGKGPEVIEDHFTMISPEILKGQKPRHITFKKGYETELSRLHDQQKSGLLHRTGRLLTGGTAYVLGFVFVMIAAVVRSYKAVAAGALLKAIPVMLGKLSVNPGFWRMLGIGVAGTGVGVGAKALGTSATMTAVMIGTTVVFPMITNLIAESNRVQVRALQKTDPHDFSANFYAPKKANKNMKYQQADPEKLERCKALNLEDYKFISANKTTYDSEPQENILAKLADTQSISAGDQLVDYSSDVDGVEDKGGHRISFYKEVKKGVHRVHLPDLKTTFLHYSGCKHHDANTSMAEEKVLTAGEVIKIDIDPDTRKHRKTVMSADEAVADLKRIYSENNPTVPTLEHDNHEQYKEHLRVTKLNKAILRRMGVRRKLKDPAFAA